MEAGALSRLFLNSTNDMKKTGYDGEPVMVDIPASFHSQWQSGFIIAIDALSEGATGLPLCIPEGQTEVEWLKMQWKTRIDDATAPIALNCAQDLRKWQNRLQGVARAQAKWAASHIGYLCPKGSSQVIGSLLYIALIGQLDYISLVTSGKGQHKGSSYGKSVNRITTAAIVGTGQS